MDIYEQVYKTGIVPVVVLNDAKDAEPLAKALVEGGLPCAEVTFRTAAAEESIRIMSEKFPDMFVGAGTVLTIEQVNRAVKAGAKFIVSPGLTPEIVKYCQNIGVPVFPGVVTPSEIQTALNLGLKVVKFFPAEPSGGLKMIQAMCAAFVGLKVMPTGGINLANVADYLAVPEIVCCGGTWVVPKDALAAGDWERIRSLAVEAAAIAKAR